MIPLRTGGATFGLMQFNDRRKGRFSPALIGMLERLGDSLAIALAHRKAQDALRESEERNRTILHTAMDGFVRVEMQGRMLEVNQAYCRMSGYTERELLERSVYTPFFFLSKTL